jgi:hypothetical protein
MVVCSGYTRFDPVGFCESGGGPGGWKTLIFCIVFLPEQISVLALLACVFIVSKSLVLLGAISHFLAVWPKESWRVNGSMAQ